MLIPQTKNLVLLVVLFICFFSSYAQNKITIELIDSESQQGISYARIIEKGGTNNYLSNDEGKTVIEVEKLPTTVVIYHLLYGEVEQSINKTEIRISLNARKFDLAEVEITQKKALKVNQQENIPIIDFEFYEDYFIFIESGKKHHNLSLYNEDSLISSLSIKKGTKEIYRDCMDNLHLVYQDSVYQIFYNYENLSLLYPASIEEFNKFIIPCKSYYNNELLSKSYSRRGLKQSFSINTVSGSKTLYQTQDSTLLSYINRKFTLQYFIKKRNGNPGNKRYQMSVTNLLANLERLQDTEPIDWLDTKIIQSNDCFAFRQDSSYQFFDFNLGRQINFSAHQKNLLNENSIAFHLDKNWSKEMWQDQLTKSIYTAYEKAGWYYLKAINQNGKLQDTETKLTHARFPEKIVIRNNRVYYLIENTITGEYRSVYSQYLN